jgi:hypothetical protein
VKCSKYLFRLISRTSIVLYQGPWSSYIKDLDRRRSLLSIYWPSLFVDHSLSISITLSLGVDLSLSFYLTSMSIDGTFFLSLSIVPSLFVCRSINLSLSYQSLSLSLFINWMNVFVVFIVVIDRYLSLCRSISYMFFLLILVDSYVWFFSLFRGVGVSCAQAPCTKVSGWLSTYEGKREQF